MIEGELICGSPPLFFLGIFSNLIPFVFFCRIKNGEFPTSNGVSFLEVQFHLMLSYCINIAFYLMLKAKGEQVSVCLSVYLSIYHSLHIFVYFFCRPRRGWVTRCTYLFFQNKKKNCCLFIGIGEGPSSHRSAGQAQGLPGEDQANREEAQIPNR